MSQANADVWMAKDVVLGGLQVKRQSLVLFFLRAAALVPLFFMIPAFVTLNVNTLQGSVADTLGTGAELNLLLCLTVTPLITMTGWQWVKPLRRWYGIVFAVTALTDATTASITTAFAGGVVGRIAGHSFLLIGLTMAIIALPLLITANDWSQKALGKYWKLLQKLTYVIWALLFVHLALLEGLGFQHGANGSGHAGDGDPVFHQRLYQLGAVSILLVVLRIPAVQKWVTAERKAGRGWVPWAVLTPLLILFAVGFSFMINELIFKGVDSFKLQPSDE